jgi:hypothetical protein
MPITTATKAANRRKSPRRKMRATVKLECRKGSYGFGVNLTHTVLDLSDTGVRLIVSQELKLLGDLEVLITSYGMRDTIKRVAIVRWQVKLEDGTFCTGIEFEKRLSFRDWQILAAPNG